MQLTQIGSLRIARSIVLCAAAISSTAFSQVQRTHVSAAFGSDANAATNCAAAAPCRFFQAAIDRTNSAGEVIVLDSGGYGAVNITKSVSLVAPLGVDAGISVFPGANGVTIPTPGVNVVLRGININGLGGNNGVAMTSGNRLTIENCIISNMSATGISSETGFSMATELPLTHQPPCASLIQSCETTAVTEFRY